MDVKRIYSGWRALIAPLLISLLVPSFGLAETILVGPTTFPEVSGQTNQFIVRFSASTTMSPKADGTRRPDQAIIDRLSNKTGVTFSHKRQMGGGRHVLKIPSSLSIGQIKNLAVILMADPNIISAEPDLIMIPFLTPNDTSYGDQWHYGSNAVNPGAVNLPTAWDISTGSSTVVVAILDTGQLPHNDIDSNILDGSGRVVPGYDMITTLSMANDGDGRDSDPTDAGDWVATNECGSNAAANSTWHGTHVAGTIGANTNNSLGVAGIDWNAKLLPIRVLGKCGGSSSDIADAIYWAAGITVAGVPDNTNPAHVINMSLGGSFPSCPSVYQDAINAAVAAGSVIVIAAGNAGIDVADFTPANCSNIITVAAADRNGGLSYYSNYGTLINITAPGGEILPYTNGILSTLDSGTTTAVNDNSYAWYQGTSMATPHVAGIAALIMGANQALSGTFLTPAQVLQHIQATSATFPVTNGAKPAGLATDTCTTSICGTGLIDTAQAMAAVTTLPTTSAGSPQTVEQSVTVTLDASASTDDGTITGYLWTQTAGTSVTLSSTTNVSPTFTSPATAGTLTFQVAVTDDVNLTSTATVDITVNPPPGPFAEAGSYQTVTAGNTVTLSSSASSASGGTITSWLWEQTDGPAVTLATPTAATTTFTAPSSYQSMTFQLTITVDSLTTYIDTVGVAAMPATVNIAPTANSGSDLARNQGVLVSLDGSASNDPDGSIASYQWTQIDGTSVTLTGATTATPSFTTPNSGGALSFKLIVTDNNGIGAVDFVGVSVRSSSSTNVMPVANAGINQSVTQSSAVTLNASSSSDADGTIASYQWTQLAGSSVSLTGATTSSASFTAPSASGALSFMLAITDNQGGSAVDFVSVSVISNNSAPLAHAGSNRTVTVGDSLTLDGTASSDSDGSISSYSWALTDGSGVTLTNATTSTPTVTTSAIGTVTFQLQVTDNNGATAIDTVAVFINAVAASAGANEQLLDLSSDSNNDGMIDSLALSLGLDPYVVDGDSDGDGISDIIEIGNVNNPVDSDNDGVFDAIEPGVLANNASILGITISPTAANSLNTPELAGELIRIVSNDQYPLSIQSSRTGLAVHAPAELVSNNNSYHYPFGLYAFRVHNGSTPTANVSIYFPPSTDFSQPLVIRKQDSQGQWRDFPYGSIDYSNHSVTLALVDNDEFDLDPRRGTILDPVGPGVMTDQAPSSGGGVFGTGMIMILLIRWAKQRKTSEISV